MHKDHNRVIYLINLKRYQEARQMLYDLLANNPESVSLLLLLAQVSNIEDKHRECIQHSEACLALEPNLAEAIYLRGMSYCRLEESAKGIKLIEEAIELEPEESDYKLGLAQVLLNHTYLSQAEELCRDVLYYDSENGVAFALLAYMAQEKGNKREAKAFRDEALRLDPYNNSIKAMVGGLNLTIQDRAESAALLREALFHFPEKSRLREKLIDTELSETSKFYSWIVMKYNMLNVIDYTTTIVCMMVLAGVAMILQNSISFILLKVLTIGLTIWQVLFWTLRFTAHYRYYQREWNLTLRDFISPQYLIHAGMILFFVSFLVFLITGNFLWFGTSLIIGVLCLMVLNTEENFKGQKLLRYSRIYIGIVAVIGLLNFVAYWGSSSYVPILSNLLFLSLFGVVILFMFYELIIEIISQIRERVAGDGKSGDEG